ncbi:MAG: hypothetical protein ACLQJ0_18445 [Steroidobacteraceae bacterium]
MPLRDRRFWVTLAIWAAIPVGSVVAGIGAFVASSPHWGFGLCAAGLLGAYAVTLHLLERKPTAPHYSSAIIISVAVLTWAFIGWQTWLVFHSPVHGYTQAQLDKAVEDGKAQIQSKLDAAQKTIADLKNAPSLAPVVTQDSPTQAGSKQIIIDVNPNYLISLYEGKLSSQGDMLFAPYVGKWIKLTARVEDVSAKSVFSIIQVTDNHTRGITMLFDEASADRLSVLTRGQSISLLCQIAKSSETLLLLNHCEFADK